jgi:hypothetical protein
MVEKILVVKANMDKLQLAPPIDADSNSDEEEILNENEENENGIENETL